MGEPISYAELTKMFEECGQDLNPIVRYEIGGDGWVYYYREDGMLSGMSSRECLDYLLANAPKES